MVLDMVTSPSFGPAGEVLSHIIDAIIEVVFSTKNVFIEKESFNELASYLDRIVPLLKALKQNNINKFDGLSNFLESLNLQIKLAKQLIAECSKKNRVYLLVSCRSIAKRLQNITMEISRALSLIPLSSLDVSSSIIEEVYLLCENMRSVEFKTALAEEEILEKIESGIHERNVDRLYANKLLLSIAEVVGISTERSALKKEFEDFKAEIENAQLRKDQAEAIQLDQIIALLERADAASSPEEKERKYLSKRNSLGSQPLEPLQSFYCPITKEVMVDPVETSSGHTFERSAIEKWMSAGSNLCPLTAIPLESSMLRPNKTLRQSIEEWKDRNTMITIASMKPKLSLENEADVLPSLELLQDLCQQRDDHREWIVLENYIPIIIELLGAKKPDIRNQALVTLRILAKDSDDAKDRIARVDNAVESIVRSLGRRVGEQKLAVALLLELSKYETIRDCIGKVQGCILLLVTMSNSNGDIQAAQHARELLENLSFSDHNVIQMAKANYFKHLLIRLSSGPEDVKMLMATTLAEMELTDHNKSSLFEEDALDSLLSLLSNGDLRMKEVSAKALRTLSTLPSNGWLMIRQGSTAPLLHYLYHHTSTQSLREHVAATIMHLAISTTSPNSSCNPVSLLECDGEVDGLFASTWSMAPTVQQSILRALHALCQSPSATIIKAKLKQSSENLQELAKLLEGDNLIVRANAVKLFCCLTEDGDKATIFENVGSKSIETLVGIIESSNDEDEIASAMGIIANLPTSSQLTDWVLGAGGIPVIFRHLLDARRRGPSKNQLIENAVGSICHLTIPTNQQSQKKAAEGGIIPVLVQLLDTGTSLTKRRASISLAQFSKSSTGLSRPIAKPLGLFRCLSTAADAGCPVHRGFCTVESSFCLLEADAVSPLVRLLGEPNLDTCEASLDALLTLIEGERLQSGTKVLSEANGISPIIKLLGTPSPSLQEKVLNSLERIFRLIEFKQKYGPSAQMSLVDLTQRGNNRTKSLAAKILAQLDVLHEQSSYF